MKTGPGRASWCYGVPGLARAQQLAGRAIGDPERKRLAEAAMAACLSDARQLDQITNSGLCHGYAGTWHTARRIAADSPEPPAWNGPIRDALCQRLRSHLERHGTPEPAGLLEGSAGLELIEHTEPAGPAPFDDWDACLLLTIPHHPDQATTGSTTP